MLFKLENKEYLFLLIIIPVLFIGFIIYLKNYRKRLASFADLPIMKQLMPLQSVSRQVLKFSLLMLALAFFIFALARPQFGSKLKEVKKEGIEMIIALDVSYSMMAKDIKPNRLERAKQAINNLVNKMDDDLIGLIVFAGEAYTQLPITNDFVSAKLFLSNISPDNISRQGTAIGEAIRLGINSFTPNEETSKAIIVISDGENHEGNAIDAAKEAAQKGIKVYTIGIGTTTGHLIPLANRQGYVKDKDGNPVTSRMNPDMLREIAEAGNGTFTRATSSNVGLNNLYRDLNKLDKAEFETRVYSEYNDQYAWFVFIGLILLLTEVVIMERKNKWLSSIKIFK